jgi:XRE family aerobic/anaerobic benzoate catabolism transcriptional regulator
MTTKTDIEGPRPEAAAILSRVARRVRDRRASLQWTAKELASRSGISPRFVSDLEAGRGNISIGRLASVALALGVDVGRLVEEEPRPEVPDGPRIVALLGLRGAGKTTLGQRLAAALGVRFVELDDAIEDAAGLSLAEIFSLHGEGYYRRLEAAEVTRLLEGVEPLVIACSGGLVQNVGAFDVVRSRCRTVWLQAAPVDHMSRVLQQGDRRPVAGRTDAMQELRAILASREPLYRTAEIHVDTSALGEAAALGNLLTALG